MLNGKKIGIVGLGLIGGSIEKCLLEKQAELGLSQVKTVSKSQKREYSIHDLADCDVIFLCSEQSKILGDLDEIAKTIAKSNSNAEKPFANALITDVASTKKKISDKAKELGLSNFIAGHPMAGTEHEGYAASFPELFHGSNWILEEKNEKTKLLEHLILKVLGAKEIVALDAETHDKLVAVVSHLPMLMSFALADLLKSYPVAEKIIGPGFRGMTRLAKGNVQMSKEILALNRQNVKDLWSEYSTHLNSLLDLPTSLLEPELAKIKKLLENVR